MGKITKRILANIFFFLLIFQSLSAQNSQRIDLSLKEQTLKVFLEIVEQKTNYTFMYNNLDLEQKISVQVKQATIDELLKKALTDRKSTRLNSSHTDSSRMPSSA